MPPNELFSPDDAEPSEALSVVRKSSPHDSARMHVRGAAPYIDDILEPTGTLHIAPGLSTVACGKLLKLDLDKVLQAPGVV